MENAELERLAAIGEIAAEVAHELRNALQIISANVYLAKQDLARSEPFLSKIERNARVAHAIVDDLMALARGEPAHAEPVLLAEVMMAAREQVPEPEKGGAVYEDRLVPNDLRVRAHPGLLSRLFHVLYENAVLAAAPSKVTIVTHARARAEDGAVVIDVADDGPGVPDAIAQTLFEPLVTARAGGSGLGLALARRVAAAHGATIALLPKEAGARGATFRVVFAPESERGA